ncbi:mechanosensitive ion channel family protein [Erysipelothrix sp. HDW6C]|uniref:mechanosensitive ion channel family protein n=1 Tax=Erysipelothrix sp. HDW6C TaxID=2714930 RepID=UPI00140C3CFC|nr:mechanosensitive ion channel family protein [Erysipelothrix sp. HDW6C]QIK69703.1 mechanosensitive ion channel family protein [Erysipelothrix sp. HDW6C]
MESVFRFLRTSLFAPRVLTVIIVFAILYFINTAIKKTIQRLISVDVISANKKTIYLLIAKIIRYVLYVIAGTFALEIFGVSTTPLLAIGSAISVAVGLGAQKIVKDVIAGFIILTDNQYVLGDNVEIEGYAGEVIDVTLLSTVLRNAQTGAVYSIPNGEVKVVTNYSRDYMIAVVDIPVLPTLDSAEVLAIVAEIVAPLQDEMMLEPIHVDGVVAITNLMLTVRVSVKTKPSDFVIVERKLRNIIQTELNHRKMGI